MRKIAAVAAAALAAAAVAGCTPQYNDLKNVPQVEPDAAVVYAAPDGYPNLVVTCIEGVAFVLTTRDYEPVMRVPELDRTCGTAR